MGNGPRAPDNQRQGESWHFSYPFAHLLSAVFLEGVRQCLPPSGRSNLSYLEFSIRFLCLIHDRNIFPIVNYDYPTANLKTQDIQAYIPSDSQGLIRGIYEGHPSPHVYICTLGQGSQKPVLGAVLQESSVLFF